jgi:hypothetical protein
MIHHLTDIHDLHRLLGTLELLAAPAKKKEVLQKMKWRELLHQPRP